MIATRNHLKSASDPNLTKYRYVSSDREEMLLSRVNQDLALASKIFDRDVGVFSSLSDMYAVAIINLQSVAANGKHNPERIFCLSVGTILFCAAALASKIPGSKVPDRGEKIKLLYAYAISKKCLQELEQQSPLYQCIQNWNKQASTP